MSTKGKATPEQTDQLLDRLATDDQFREKFLGDPVSALAEHGVHVDPADVPAVRSLPAKEHIQAQRETIKAQMGGKVGLPFFALQA